MVKAVETAKRARPFAPKVLLSPSLKRPTCIRCGTASKKSRRSARNRPTRRSSGAGGTSSTFAERAAGEVAIDDVERRALILVNPAFAGETVTTSNLIGAFTVLDPGDRARPHRHTFAAIRFATRADGAATIVNGRRCEMREGDLILTPPMCWHGHVNDSNHRIIWFDAANIPLIRSLDANFFEPGDPDTMRSGRPTKATSGCGPSRALRRRHATRGRAFAEISLFRRSHAPAAGGATGGAGRRAHRALHQSRNRRRGHAGARLLFGPALAKDADAAAAHDQQRDLSRRVRRRTLAHRRRTISNGRSTTSSAFRTGPGRATRRLTAMRISSSSPTNRPMSGSICCARNCNRRPGQGREEGIGAPVRRVEDIRLLRGGGCFVADVVIPGELHAAIVRSPHAHAAIRNVEASAALAAPGVVAVFSGADMAADRVGPMRALWAIKADRRQTDGRAATLGARAPARSPRRRACRARDRADARAGASTRRTCIEVDYEALPAIVDAREAARARSAPQLHDGGRREISAFAGRAATRPLCEARCKQRHACDAHRSRQQPADRSSHRAARGAGRGGRREREADAL